MRSFRRSDCVSRLAMARTACELRQRLTNSDGDFEDLLESLDANRERRNEASYAAEWVSAASVPDAREATAELIELARAFMTR